MKNYSYPRVTTSVTALKRSATRPAAEDTTVLFAPIIAETGPVQELVKIHSLEEYISKFGADKRMGLTLLNISNWLTAGGTLYAYRIVGNNAKAGAFEVTEEVASTDSESENPTLSQTVFSAKAKHIGKFLKDSTLQVSIDNCIVAATEKAPAEDTTPSTDTQNDSGDNSNDSGNDVVENSGEGNSEAQATVEYDYACEAILTVKIVADGIIKERFSLKVKGTADETITLDVSKLSEYIESVDLMFKVVSDSNSKFYLYLADGKDNNKDYITDVKFSGGSDNIGNDVNSYFSALETFWNGGDKSDLQKALGNHLETPIDLIMDACYPLKVKKLMVKAISHKDSRGEVDALRPDIRGYFDLYCEGYSYETTSSGSSNTTTVTEKATTLDYSTLDSSFEGPAFKETSNVFFFDQSIVISEETYFGEDKTVGPSYFLSSLVPANDLENGIQMPVAGKRRAELKGIKKLSLNPDADEKDARFLKRVNYIEKDSRGYYFMSQRTYDKSTEDEYTALSFINNSRVTCKMVHDIERLGRDYLFEFNDATTLANMRSVLNRYVTNWISNRTLSFGEVDVSPDEYSGERVNVTLRIKFTGTIEVISVDIILE